MRNIRSSKKSEFGVEYLNDYLYSVLGMNIPSIELLKYAVDHTSNVISYRAVLGCCVYRCPVQNVIGADENFM